MGPVLRSTRCAPFSSLMSRTIPTLWCWRFILMPRRVCPYLLLDVWSLSQVISSFRTNLSMLEPSALSRSLAAVLVSPWEHLAYSIKPTLRVRPLGLIFSLHRMLLLILLLMLLLVILPSLMAFSMGQDLCSLMAMGVSMSKQILVLVQ